MVPKVRKFFSRATRVKYPSRSERELAKIRTIATAHCTRMEKYGVSYLGCTLPKDLKNSPSLAIAYSILGWNMIQLDREPITTITAMIATMVPA